MLLASVSLLHEALMITCRKHWLRKTGSPTSIIVKAVFKNQADVISSSFRYFERRNDAEEAAGM